MPVSVARLRCARAYRTYQTAETECDHLGGQMLFCRMKLGRRATKRQFYRLALLKANIRVAYAAWQAARSKVLEEESQRPLVNGADCE